MDNKDGLRILRRGRAHFARFPDGSMIEIRPLGRRAIREGEGRFGVPFRDWPEMRWTTERVSFAVYLVLNQANGRITEERVARAMTAASGLAVARAVLEVGMARGAFGLPSRAKR